MMLSLVIPAHNEQGEIERTVLNLSEALTAERIAHELLVVNDHSTDGTEGVLHALQRRVPGFRFINNSGPGGYGMAVRAGLASFQGDVVAVVMADNSDRPEDVVGFYRVLCDRGVDCVFGTRWSGGGSTIDYPLPKLVLNRAANKFIQLLFWSSYDDFTNAFKMFRREVIEGIQPILSHHFNLTVELPLKAMVRGFSYCVVPNVWINRKTGISKLKVKEMGSRYLFIVLYCWLEKWLSRGDYHQSNRPLSTPPARPAARRDAV
jgi:dolichol-phosphate mannosyltransferase